MMASESSPWPSKAKAASTVVIPMALQAFVVSEDFQNSEYQVAPLTQPNFAALRPRSGELAHDIMDQLDTSFWRMQSSYNSRFVDLATGIPRKDRTGVYLSWCLPFTYRAGITATESATASKEATNDYDEIRRRAGYALGKKKGIKNGIQFRPAPDRWLIFRHSLRGDGTDHWVLVESNCMRNINDDDLSAQDAPDIENITSAAVNPDLPVDDQHNSFMGRSMTLDSPTFQDSNKRKYRRPFNAFEAGNELFVDYQPFNTGVFSFFDDLKGVNDAVFDYTVIGYHSYSEDDPLAINDLGLATSEPLYNAELLDSLSLKLDVAVGSNFLKAHADSKSRTLSHAILRNVLFSREFCNLKAPSILLQETLYYQQPVAVGLHTLDALAAYLHVQSGTGGSSSAVHKLLGQLVMLILRDDDVDSQRKAADEVSSNDWITKAEGTVWQLPKHKDETGGFKGAEPAPPDTHRNMLVGLNDLQQRLDTCLREQLQLCQELFGCWWNAVGLRELPQALHTARRAQVKKQAVSIAKKLTQLESAKYSLRTSIGYSKTKLVGALKGKPLARASGRPFGVHQDPTILFAGAKSGWPKGFSKPLPVRLASEIAPESESKTRKRIPNDESLKTILPSLSEPLLPLLRELAESDQGERDWRASAYADLENMNGTQGWFPLYIEWEVQYYHIPFTHWDLKPDPSTGRWRYVIPETDELSASIVSPDCRTLHGRTTITTQSGDTLHTRLEQLFAQTKDKDLIQNRDKLLQNVANLEYFSSSLGGFIDHLLTLRRGPHPEPSTNDPKILEALGLTADQLAILETTTRELAPYGATTPLPPDYTAFSPFKPVTHGQVRFTKLVIVDKFGQVVSGIKPGHPGQNQSALYPCISPSFACGVLAGETSDYYPNTVVKADTEANVCQFFQIPPRINQRARLNVHYMMPRADNSSRRIASEWDNPVWGWLLVNYQSHSIQFYNTEGNFNCEILLDKKSRTTSMSIGPNVDNARLPQGRLKEFIDQMKNFSFAEDLFGMLSGAVDSVRSTSADFEGMLPAAFGRPFCLADIGVSIELATPPLEDASLLTAPKQYRQHEPDLKDYKFPVVLGNHTAAFDGLVGTFPATGKIDTIQTGYQRYEDQGEIITIKAEYTPDSIPLSPYFIGGDSIPNIQAAHAAKLKCISAILDPKCPIHVYSGSLFPLVELSLPKWTTDSGMKNMHAFFAAGPILVPEKPRLGGMHTQKLKDAASIQMPLGGPGNKWQWLQPRIETPLEEGTPSVTIWDPVIIKPLDSHLKVEAAKSSELVEGFVLVQ